MDILQHIVSNDHGEWNMLASWLTEQWPLLRSWFITRFR